MIAEEPATLPMTEATHRARFFRQSGWLMIANIAGGVLMWAVHPLARATGEGEYGLFITLLSTVMLVPAIPLQMVFAQQTAKAVATGRERELSALARSICLGLFVGWALVCAGVAVFQGPILRLWHVNSPPVLWVTMLTLLLALWAPVFMGILQGEENFLWLGWSMLSNGVGRLAAAAVAVLAFHTGALGMMIGVLMGLVVAMVIALWQTKRFWTLPALAFDWSSMLRQIIPLIFGFLFVQFLFSGDTLFVRHYFTEDATGAYGSAGTLARALIWLVGPLATVMFPRIVHSSAKSQQTDIMKVVLLGTSVLAIGGAVGLAVLGRLAVRLVYGQKFVAVAGAVLPWYGLAMVPLALANVLVNNLLARSQFAVVPFIALLAVVYAAAMVYVNQVGHSLVLVLQTLGGFNFLLLLVCAWCTWGAKSARPQAAPSL